MVGLKFRTFVSCAGEEERFVYNMGVELEMIKMFEYELSQMTIDYIILQDVLVFLKS